MKYRWMVSEDAGATFARQVTPAGVSNPLFEWSKETGSARAGKRLKLASSLTFSAKDDYEYLKARKMSEGECASVPIRFELRCGGVWEVLWTGRFPAGGGRWDLRKCHFTIKPQADDRFTCVLERQDVKTNLMNAGVVDAMASAAPSIEWASCVAVVTNTVPLEYNFDCSDGVTYDPDTPPENWWVAHEWSPGLITIFDTPIDTHQIYWREVISTECVGGDPVPPPGAGWVLLTNNCDTDGTAVYIREPLIAYSFGDPIAGTCDGDIPVHPDTPCEGPWVSVSPCGLTLQPAVGDPVTYPPYFICYDYASVSLPRARTLESCLDLLIDRMECGLAGVRSDFFGINAPGDAPGYVAGLNYVTGLPTQTEAVVILHKTDVIDPDATQPATRGEWTFKEMMRALTTMYQVLWDIDADGYLRIEHYIYWNNQLGLDLTVVSNEVVEPLAYEALNDEVPNVERLSFLDALGSDFVGKGILYSGPCVTEKGENGEVEYSLSDVTTDVSMIISDPTSVSRKGFVFLATVFDGSTYNTIIDQGAITGNFVSNAPLSCANLQRDFWTWNRYLPEGNMNGSDVTFDGFRPTKVQEDVTVKCFACDVLNFNADRLVRTKLGDEHFDVDATVEKATLDTNGNLRLSLRYSV